MSTLKEIWKATRETEKEKLIVPRKWKDTDIRGRAAAKEKGKVAPMSAFTTTVTGDVVETLRRIHARRSPQARAADAGFNAPITTDEERWRKNPNRLDFPGVDTIPAAEAAKRAAPVIVRLKEKGHLHSFSYEKKTSFNYGAYNPHGFATKKRKVLYVSEVTGKPRYYYEDKRSDKPEIRIYKPKYNFLKETEIQRTHTVAHEAGHALDWAKKPERVYGGRSAFENVYSGTLKKTYKAEMLGLTKHVRGEYKDKDYRERSNEMIADAIASFVLQPRATKRELHKQKKGDLFYLELKTATEEVLGPGWRKARTPRKKGAKKSKDPFKGIFESLEF